uniref:Leukocyte surface antigen CD47 n=1 Tax=Otus sunia TaxID=257818 RepID=A0A8C8AQ86_9STRI
MCHFSFFFLGSAQLMFSVTDFVEKTECNKTVILPCHVINLKANNANVMFVTWKKQGQGIFSFDGAKQQFYRHATVPSANLASLADLPKGVASLMLDGAEAAVGNYSCEVTELNREGETTVELRQRIVLIIKSVYFSERICMSDSLKYEIVPQKKRGIIVAGVIFTAAAVVGTVLFVQGKCTKISGLGLIVLPAVILVPLQYFMFGMVFDSLPQATFALIGLQILGYIIAVVGFALCVSGKPFICCKSLFTFVYT